MSMIWLRELTLWFSNRDNKSATISEMAEAIGFKTQSMKNIVYSKYPTRFIRLGKGKGVTFCLVVGNKTLTTPPIDKTMKTHKNKKLLVHPYGQKVKIKTVGVVGWIDEICIKHGMHVEYLVIYWSELHRCSTWVTEDEVEPAHQQRTSIGFHNAEKTQTP